LLLLSITSSPFTSLPHPASRRNHSPKTRTPVVDSRSLPSPPTATAIMSDKKNEDYTIRMPDSDSRSPFGEKEPFIIPKRPARAASNSPLSSRFAKIENNPAASILAYCFASISMTVVNKYVVSGSEWNLNFFYLAIQVTETSLFLPREMIAHTTES
jgi:hypothetical protein